MNIMAKLKSHALKAGFFLALTPSQAYSTDVMDEMASKYIRTLSPEVQSSIGIKEMRGMGKTIHHDHNTHYLGTLRQSLVFFDSQLQSFRGAPLQRREIEYVRNNLETSIALVEKTIQDRHVTVISSPLSNLLDPADEVFEGINSLVLLKAPRDDIASRFRFYVHGNETARPFITAIQEELEALTRTYGAQGKYPYIKHLEDILDEKKITAIVNELRTLLSTEGAAIDTFHQQVQAYHQFVRNTLLPRASNDCGMPKDMYALRLKLYGIEGKPMDIMSQGLETYRGMYKRFRDLANDIAKKRNDPARYPVDDPAAVINALIDESKLNDPQEVISMYRRVQSEIQDIITRTRFVSLPQRPGIVRPGTDAEEAIIPVPHVNTPNFIGNDGTVWPEFVLCDLLGNSDPIVAYGLTAHEGRPGHDLQFSRMLELTLAGKMNLFESVLADNPTNVEGWAHYVEYAMSEHFTPEARLGAMRDQLLRMARTFLDPQLNFGFVNHQDVTKFHYEILGFHDQTGKSEADRYSFRYPGQAVSYRYGAQAIMNLRDKLQKKMGDRFSLLKFHDALLSFGLLPISIIEDFIEERM